MAWKVPEQQSGETTVVRQRKPHKVGDILNYTLKYNRLDKKFKRYKGFKSWPDIVGQQLADVSFPERIAQNGTLVVKVFNASWSQELSMIKNDIIQKYNKHPDTIVVNDIRFSAGNPKDFAQFNKTAV